MWLSRELVDELRKEILTDSFPSSSFPLVDSIQTTSEHVADEKGGKFVTNIAQRLEDVMGMGSSDVRKVGKTRRRKRQWNRFVAGERSSVKRGSQKRAKSERWERKRIVATRCFGGSGWRILSVRERDAHSGEGGYSSPKRALFQFHLSGSLVVMRNHDTVNWRWPSQ